MMGYEHKRGALSGNNVQIAYIRCGVIGTTLICVLVSFLTVGSRSAANVYLHRGPEPNRTNQGLERKTLIFSNNTSPLNYM